MFEFAQKKYDELLPIIATHGVDAHRMQVQSAVLKAFPMENWKDICRIYLKLSGVEPVKAVRNTSTVSSASPDSLRVKNDGGRFSSTTRTLKDKHGRVVAEGLTYDQACDMQDADPSLRSFLILEI